MVEMTVESVRINLTNGQRVVILKGTHRPTATCSSGSPAAEAAAIAMELQGTTSPRPLTHDLQIRYRGAGA